MTVNKKIWVITTRGQVVELPFLSSGDCVKWWCYEGDEKWQKGDPPNIANRMKKDESRKTENQIFAF